MTGYTIALTANAGISVTFPSAIIWVDALHAIKAPSYSTVTPEIWEHIIHDPDYIGRDLEGPDAIAFSHCHIDHFSADIVKKARLMWPDAKIILPEKYFPDEYYVSGNETFFNINDVNLHFFRTFHSTKRQRNKTHYSLTLSDGNASIFMPVDSSLSDSNLHYQAVSTDIDIAIVDFIWLMLEKGRDIIENDIRPKHLIAYHLPFAEDDRQDYRTQVREAAGLIKGIPDIRILDSPFQKEIITV